MPLTPDDTYGLSTGSNRKEIPAPELPYRPIEPARYRPKIGLVGCGGISVQHLRAYSAAGYDVAVLCDLNPQKARALQERFYPQAAICTDWHELLTRDDVEVLDLAAHPAQRAEMFEPAIEAGKHILSQKPFVTDLDFGLRIVVSARAAVSWDHTWIKGSVFESIHFIVLYDFGIHWFDIMSCFMRGKTPRRVYASVAPATGQQVAPPLLSQVLVEYENAQASLSFDADTLFGEQDRTFVSGTRGALWSDGPDLNTQAVTLATAEGRSRPALSGTWFPDGFHGTMAELLRSVEEKREPENGSRNNLESLALCFAALESARRHEPVAPWSARSLRE